MIEIWNQVVVFFSQVCMCRSTYYANSLLYCSVSGALCENCIPEWIFSVCFWLGYFNSCLNPVIYACTSREFQRAFRRILCRKTPPRPHLSRAVYRANNLNTRFIERDYNGGAHLGNGTPPGIPMIPISHWR